MGLIDELLTAKHHITNSLSNPILVKVMLLFQKGELEGAKKLLSKLNKSDKLFEKENGLEWLLNKKYLEILLHIELGNIDFVDSRILSLIRTHGAFFNKSKKFQVLEFLKLVKIYHQTPSIVRSKQFKEKVEKSLVWKPIEQEDLFLISFYAWLKSKMENKPIYNVTLELINQTK
jgi:hypothetical protein